MCAALGKSHRWSKAVALSRWARALEKARADEFAEEMLRCVCACYGGRAGGALVPSFCTLSSSLP